MKETKIINGTLLVTPDDVGFSNVMLIKKIEHLEFERCVAHEEGACTVYYVAYLSAGAMRVGLKFKSKESAIALDQELVAAMANSDK